MLSLLALVALLAGAIVIAYAYAGSSLLVVGIGSITVGLLVLAFEFDRRV